MSKFAGFCMSFLEAIRELFYESFLEARVRLRILMCLRASWKLNERRTMRLLYLLFAFVCFPAYAQHGLRTVTPEQAQHQAETIRAGVSPELADGLELSLWASEELVFDPIALFIDDQGRAYYSRTNRQDNSEFDIRGHRDWMIPSISFKTVEDRRAFLRKELSPENSERNERRLDDLNGDGLHDWRDLTIEKEEIYRVEDTSGDGLADKAQLIVEDFNEEHTDVAGAVLYHNGELFVGVGPDMWRLKDTDGDGVMDEKTSISHGYAIHIGFGAHGMSGLTVGPDGRIYWGIGDIGFYGTDQTGKLWDYSNQGVIVRSNPDGSDFEVYAAGLRNTHEFVFDQYGNIITEDNDGDHPGEHERLAYIVNGHDAGWRTNWQFGKYVDPDNNLYKVWMDEEYFKPRFEGQAAHLVPPIQLYHNGPAGMKFNPGTALGDDWKDHFFVAEFVGNPTRSRVHAFTLKPAGAGFELADERVAISGVLTSGLAFGADGALYLADWLDGWGTKNKGRIWKLDVPGGANTAERVAVKQLLGSGFADKSNKELGRLLEHADMRVRQNAQFELVTRGRKGRKVFRRAAKQTMHQLARVHALWGLAQMARNGDASGSELAKYLGDNDPEIRAQAAKMLGDLRYEPAAGEVLPLLKDSQPRPRFFAAEALGRMVHAPAVQPIISMLEANDDEDVYLRHAGALALARIGNTAALLGLESHPSRALRLAAVVALRRLGHAGVAGFLDDEDEYIATDAARAINDDASIEAALPALAKMLEISPYLNEAFIRRSINANSRLGGEAEARRVAAFALRSDVDEALRVEAVEALAVWSKPSVLDRVDGTLRGEVERDPAIAKAAMQSVSARLLADGSAAVRLTTVRALDRMEIRDNLPALTSMLENDANPEVRSAALATMLSLEKNRAVEVVQTALVDDEQAVRMEALERVPELTISDEEKASMLAPMLYEGSIEEKQRVLTAFGTLGGDVAAEVLTAQVDSLEYGAFDAGALLELGEAVSSRESLSERYDAYLAGERSYAEALEGGDARSGAQIFYRHEGAQCTRCHTAGRGGGDVGPNLERIGAQLSREQLLESMVDPNARIATGYGESASAMPNMSYLLTPREIRDLVAFLVELK